MKNSRKCVHCLVLWLLLTCGISATKNTMTSYLHFRTSIPQDDKSYFSLRRLAIFGNYQIAKWAAISIRFIYKAGNRSSTDDKIYLQHAYINLFLSPLFCFKIGQFKPPFGWERFVPDYRLIGVERSQVIDRLIPVGSLGASFARDYGIQVYNNAVRSPLSYELAVMTGSGANTSLTTKNAPLLIGRISFKKMFKLPSLINTCHLLMQLAYSYRCDTDINFNKQLPGVNESLFSHFKGRDYRFNAALHLKNGAADFAAEYIRASFRHTETGRPSIFAYGWYTQVSYSIDKNVEVFFKFECFAPYRRCAPVQDIKWMTLGINYYFNHQKSRIMLNYIHKIENINIIGNNMLILQLQYFLLDI